MEVGNEAWWYSGEAYDNFTLPAGTWQVEYWASTNSEDDERETTYLYHINQSDNELKSG